MLFQLKEQAARSQDPLQIWAANEIESLRNSFRECQRAYNRLFDELERLRHETGRDR